MIVWRLDAAPARFGLDDLREAAMTWSASAPLWFDGWAGPLRVAVVGVSGYVAIAALLRISGKRTLGKFNAFDWVGTVAIGSTLANLMLSPDVPLFTGLTALGLLVLIQFLFSYVAMRSERLRSWMRSD